MYSNKYSEADLRDCRRYARAVISASFIASLRHVQTLRRLDESIETVRRKITVNSKDKNFEESSENENSSDATTTTSRTKKTVSISVSKDSAEKKLSEPSRPKPWSPVTDGRKAIITMIDQMWSVPYAPCQYVVQFICSVTLNALHRHKYCVRWQNGRRSAMFYVNIDETKWETSVWVNFPGETKAHRPHTSSANFHRFLQRNLF